MRQSKDILEALIDYRRDIKRDIKCKSAIVLDRYYNDGGISNSMKIPLCKIDEEDWMYFFNKHKKFYKEELKEELSDLIEEQDGFIKTIENIKEF